MRTLKFSFALINLVWVAILMLSSCSRSPRENNVENVISNVQYVMTPVDTVNIEIDTLTSNSSRTFNYRELGGKRLLLVFNYRTNQIQAYDLSSKRNVFKVPLSREGPNAIPELAGFYFHSFDSIFLMSLNSNNRIFLVDTSGRVKDKFSVIETLPGGNVRYDISMDEYFQMTYDRKTSNLTFWAAPFINRGTKEFYQFPLIVDYNVKGKIVSRNYGYYPPLYRGENIYFLNEAIYRLLGKDSTEIHYFDASHHLYIYDYNSKELIKTVGAKSRFLPEFIEPSMKSGDEKPVLQEQANHYITKGRYCRLLYDGKNNLYYRIVRQPQELRGPDGLLNGKIDSKMAVMVLNGGFEYGGETELREKTFLDDFSFVSDGMLWINMNHPENKENKENYLSFILYKPLKASR